MDYWFLLITGPPKRKTISNSGSHLVGLKDFPDRHLPNFLSARDTIA